MQSQHEHAASSNRAFLASVNHGRPTIAATARPGEFNGRGVVAAREAQRSVSSNGQSEHESRRTAELRAQHGSPDATPGFAQQSRRAVVQRAAS